MSTTAARHTNTAAQTRALARILGYDPAAKTRKRLADGTILISYIPAWEQGRKQKDGSYLKGPGRSFTYAIHKDGRLCGHGYKDCGCGQGQDETQAARSTTLAATGKLAAARKQAAQAAARKTAAAKRQPRKRTTAAPAAQEAAA